MVENLKVEDLIVARGVIYRVIKVDDEKGLYLLEKRVPTEEMSKKAAMVIEKSGWDILRIRNGRAKLIKDSLPKRIEEDE